MNERRQNLLDIIITHYTKTAQPVGSKLIFEQGKFGLSPATIRNEMAELEREGFIFQPHTSAGRVPTEKGYQFYVNNFLQEKDLSRKHQDYLINVIKPYKRYQPELIKELAKGMAELSSGAVFVGFSSNNIYYTGLANLFSQPEFVEHQLVYNLSRVIDHLDQAISKVFSNINDKAEILIGNKNPFGRDCSAILAKYKKGNEEGLLGILGPVRMDYQNNYSLIAYIQNLINNF